jgi:23S rRNA (guanosine2251-2'-O)-methyltransferase
MSQKPNYNNDFEIVYGAHPIIELIKAGKRKLNCIYTTRPYPRSWERITQALASRKVDIRYVDKAALDKIAGNTDHMGVIAFASPFVYKKEIFAADKYPLVLALDGVQDVKNMGAILRSAYCTGFKAVILTRKGCAPINAAALKASAGLAHHLEIFMAPSLESALKEMHKNKYHNYMAVLDGGTDIREIKINKPLCVVIGNEEKGIKKNLFSQGQLITLPQINNQVSYNASVAAGILMFHLAFNS